LHLKKLTEETIANRKTEKGKKRLDSSQDIQEGSFLKSRPKCSQIGGS